MSTTPEIPYRKKLIEVALPLQAISDEASLRKRKAPAGYPTMIHKWWAQRPIAACSAVLFGQLVDDPGSVPAEFPTEDAQRKERERLFALIEELVKWKNSNDESILHAARVEIVRSFWRDLSAEEMKSQPESLRQAFAASPPFAAVKATPEDILEFLQAKVPPVYDPFCGGGSIPLEAQRLGLRAIGTDLNPIPVLITTALIEIPPRFRDLPPVNPEARKQTNLQAGGWKGAAALAADVRYYGEWIREEAYKRIGHLYPKVKVTADMADGRLDLRPYVGRELAVIAWLWARTVKCPNPACGKRAPMVASFDLSTKKGGEACAVPQGRDGAVTFTIERKKSSLPGTKDRYASRCLHCGSDSITNAQLRDQATNHGLDHIPFALVAEGDRKRVYLSFTQAPTATPHDGSFLEQELSTNARWFSPPGYGMTRFRDLFTDRQLVALITFSDLVAEAMQRAERDAGEAGLPDDGTPFREGGRGARAYGEAVGVYLAFGLSRMADYGSTIATWRPKDNAMRSSLAKQAIPMTWDFAEGSPFGTSSSGWIACVDVVAKVLERLPARGTARADQDDASHPTVPERGVIVSTDPPYFDNVSYADLSDFYYVLLRRVLRQAFPEVTATLTTPKVAELIAAPHRHGGDEGAEKFFMSGMSLVMNTLGGRQHTKYPIAVYYAFKQSEAVEGAGVASTGWETFLASIIDANLEVVGTWPLRTEGDNRQVGIGANALASSIVLVCRPRAHGALEVSQADFVRALKSELPEAVRKLQQGNIAPVDLQQAAIGPGMAVFTRYKQVLEADGSPMRVRRALERINQVLDEVLHEQEGDLDRDTRAALTWFKQHEWREGPFGDIENIARARDVSPAGLIEAGIAKMGGGRFRLLKREELDPGWDPATDARATVWEAVQHTIRLLREKGEEEAGKLVARLGPKADPARELAYHLYNICERNKWNEEARAYNELITAWPYLKEHAHRVREGWRGPLDRFTAQDEEE